MRVALAGLAVVLLAACSAGGARPASRPGLTPIPGSPFPAQPGPADAGLPLVAAEDGVGALRAAALEPDQADALPLFNSWGWVTESTRSFARGPADLQETLLQVLEPSGAQDAFAYFSEQAATAPMSAGACPAAVAGLDQCVLGTGGGRTLVVGRLGAEVFAISAAGADAVTAAARQAARLRP